MIIMNHWTTDMTWREAMTARSWVQTLLMRGIFQASIYNYAINKIAFVTVRIIAWLANIIMSFPYIGHQSKNDATARLMRYHGNYIDSARTRTIWSSTHLSSVTISSQFVSEAIVVKIVSFLLLINKGSVCLEKKIHKVFWMLAFYQSSFRRNIYLVWWHYLTFLSKEHQVHLIQRDTEQRPFHKEWKHIHKKQFN